MLVTRTSLISGKTTTLDIPDLLPEELAAYKSGGLLIQQVLGHLTPDEHEFILTGSTPEEWEETFAGDDSDTAD